MKFSKGDVVIFKGFSRLNSFGNLTVGKEYTVVAGYGEPGLVVAALRENAFRIVDDEGDIISCAYPQCLYGYWELK